MLTIDAEIKTISLQSTGISSGEKQAEPLTYKDVELLWEQNALGI